MLPTVLARAAALFALPAAASFDFAPATVTPAMGGIADIVIADLDGDHDLDVATLGGFSFPDGRAFIGVLLNDGAGALSAPAIIDAGNQVGLEFFIQDLEAGDVDAQFQCPIPNRVMADLGERADIRVLRHHPGGLDRLLGAVPYYRRVTMAKGALRGIEADVDQVGVLNVLATHARVAPETVAAVVSTMVTGAAELARLNPLYAGLDGL